MRNHSFSKFTPNGNHRKSKLSQSIKTGVESSGEMVLFCSELVSEAIQRPNQMKEWVYLTSQQIYILGLQSVSLVAVAAISIGAVMALQFGNGLQRFGGSLYVPQLVGLSVFRELGPVVVSLLLAGKIGSGITSEIASMKVTEQIDAIRVLGDSPLSILVIPRVIACLIVFPTLILFGNYLSILSAIGVSYSQYAIGPTFFLTKVIETVTFTDLWTGVVKSIVFGLFTAIAGAWRGLTTVGGTEGVGASTTWIVVRASIFILLSDYFLSKLFILTVLKYG